MALYLPVLWVLLPLWVPGFYAKPSSHLNECKKTFNLPVLEVLPGGGWDNLRNIDAGQVIKMDYSQCQTTDDGAYLLPDQVFTVSLKSSEVEINSDILDSWQDYKSSTAYTINMEASGFSILNGKFSVEDERLKEHQVNDNSVTSRTQVRNLIYTVKTLPSFTLDPVFRSHVFDIANALENNNTRLAIFLSENLILDYGTHVLTSVDAGATLVQEDYLQSSFVENTELGSLTATASASFLSKVNFGLSNAHEDFLLDSYISNTTYSLMISHGGMPFYPGVTLKAWEDSIPNNLVAIDRSGVPLYFILNQDTLPDLPQYTILQLSNAVYQAFQSYYTINTHPGCTEPGTENYNYKANVDDNSCMGIAGNFSFGGVFQQCSPITQDTETTVLCQSLTQDNPLTGSLSCTAPYSQILLRSEVREQSSSQYQCQSFCYWWWYWGMWCYSACANVYTIHRATVQTYWCAMFGLNKTSSSGFLFGGLFGPNLINPVTKSRNCPDTFYPATFLSDGMKICLGDNNPMNARYSIPFGGLFSCQSGNLLAKGLSQCPAGFSQYSAGVSDGCKILFCTSSGAFASRDLAPIQLPPFTSRPVLAQNESQMNTVSIVEDDGHFWVKAPGRQVWKKVSSKEAWQTVQDNAASGSPGTREMLEVSLVIVLSLFIMIL
ncbi:macrophage-expressed gene 1 protein-like [Brienomyrus brachyistius]|uniref:macrophage-expressed gene 1 protein-like n=1 Tax=Brienomyrus brachyistius TaxID=42636 RepID=UPI0020B39587|nr:macrophage-expressed gene 1 protein-like [Brienomyrus brachyistius]